jgi:hypothetical protein
MTSKVVSQLFKSAKASGGISPEALQVINVADLGQEIQDGLGIDVDDVQASEVVLVTIMPDDSSSVRPFAQEIRDGHRLVIDSLKATKQREGILAHNRFLNGYVLYPYSRLDDVVAMDDQNYRPGLGTPLYDQTIVMLGTVLAKSQQFLDNGVPCRSVSLIITDGVDYGSVTHNENSVKKVVKDMLATENHIIAGLGIGDEKTFRKVFGDMGLDPEWILTVNDSASDIRKAFQLFSQSAVRASQGGGSFSKTAAGGFTA